MKRFLLLLAIVLIGLGAFAQKDNRLTPGLSPVTDLPIVQMPQQDNQALLDAELARRGPGIAPRYATNLEVDITPATHGQWETTPYGSVWRLRVRSRSAHSLNFGFTRYVMPAGGRLVIYRSDYTEIRGPFTPADNEDHEQLWTPLITGDDLVIEVFVPTAAIDELELKLAFVNHAFEDFSALISGSCNLDVICGAADGWGIVDPHRDIIQSVAVISTGGGTFCTGFLVNNVEDDCTPFFMTANHCGINAGNAPSLVTYWNYQNSTCREPFSTESGGAGDGQLNDFNTGSIFRAARSASDFVLVELDDPVSSTANAYFAGWDARGIAINSAIAVHHPRTDEKRISFENDPTQFTTYSSNTPTTNYTHVRVIDWDVGTTEPGSSGSPLFDQNERVVGQLHGGGAACGNNLSDWYGAFAVSWDAGGNSSSRLRDWLDPDNTGTLFINGRWANECSFALTASPLEQTTCQPDEAFYDITASTGFSGTADLDLDGLPFGTYDFSPGNIGPGGTATLTVETGSLDPGTYNFTVIGTNGGNTTEVDLTLTVLSGSGFPPDLLAPADDSDDIFPNPVLSWDGDDSGATTYTVQIATNADFSNIIETGTTTATSYQPTNASAGLTRYYWRVSSGNDCGNSGFSFPFSFVTSNVSCVTYVSDFSTVINPSGTPTVTNDIFFAEDLTIASVVIGMEVTHTYVGDLEARVFPAPFGTIDLFDRPGFPNSNFGCSEDNLLLTFSNDSPNSTTDFENICNPSETGANNPGPPYAIEGSFQPLGNFDILDGANSLGAWTLEIGDNATADGGVLEEWSVTVCYVVESEPPVVDVNQVLPVSHGTTETITDEYLLTTDAESSPQDLTYTLDFLPAEGTLLRNGQPLSINSSFTQADIDNGLVSYRHDGGAVLFDDFGFTVTNAAGMSVEDQVFQIEIIVAPLTAGLSQTGSILCNGGSEGAITVTAAGGVEPYEYALNGGMFQPGNVFTGLTAGTYSATVRDDLGTTITTATVTISQPTVLTATASVTDDVITVSAAGGTPGYLYAIDGGSTQMSNVFNDVANGDHTIQITDTNGCTTTVAATVSVNSVSLTASLVREISCHDADDAIITALASGGMPPYQYRINGGLYGDNSTFVNLGPGEYMVEVRDQEGFERTAAPITITNPALLTLSATVDGSEVTAAADGGTTPYRYQIDGGAIQSGPVFSGVSNGEHLLTVIDDHDCTANTTVTVAVNTLSVSAALVSDISCHDANDGSLNVSVSGGTSPYTYSLDGEDYQDSPLFTGLAAGTYSVVVLDGEGFTSTTNTVTINNPAQLTASASVLLDNITITAGGGTGALTYQLGSGTPQDSPVFTEVPNGTYVITVTDANGCTITTTATVAVNTLVVSAALTSDISCHDANDGRLTVSVAGGSPGYLYSLDGEDYQSSPLFEGLAAGTYTVVVLDSEGFTRATNSITITNPMALTIAAEVDENDITVSAAGGTTPYTYQLNGAAPQGSPVFNDLPNGTYLVIAIDNNGCTAETSVTVAVNSLVVSAVLTQDISCHDADDGMVMVSVSGGTAPFQFSLDGENFQDSPIFAGLPGMTFTVTVLDSEGFSQVTNEVTVTNPPLLTLDSGVIDNSIVLSAEGGTPPYTYQLNDGAVQDNPAFTDLPNGTYTTTVYDANGCTATGSATVAVNTLEVSAVLTETISCNNVSDGEIEVLVSGGTPPYMYSLDGENFQSSPIFSGLSAGNYAFVVMDAEGFLLGTNTVTLINPDPLTLETTVEEATVTATATGGTGGLMYSLDGENFQTENTFTDVPDGIYQVVVRDENGCVAATEVIVAVNGLLASLEIVEEVACFEAQNGAVQVNVSGGIAPYMYSLDGEDFQEEPTFTGLPAGEYTVTVQDAAGTTFTTTAVVLVEPEILLLTLSASQDTVFAAPTGGTAPYTYRINGSAPQDDPVFLDLMNGAYEITVEDANGCVTTSVIDVLVRIFAPVRPDLELRVYPNPNGGLFELLLSGVTDDVFDCRIYDASGVLIRQQRLQRIDMEVRQSFDLRGLPAGMYQLVVRSGTAFGLARVVILE